LNKGWMHNETIPALQGVSDNLNSKPVHYTTASTLQINFYFYGC